MGVKDIFITPIFIILLSVLAYWIRPYVTTTETRKYFLPALWARLIAAILLGLLYQFYYEYGDTYVYHTDGSSVVWNAFLDNWLIGFRLIFGANEYTPELFEYGSQIRFYRDDASYFVIRVAAFFDILTANTYSATALFFATFSFSGTWAMYMVLVRKYENFAGVAFAVLFFPSMIFWGSGLLKDTLVIGTLGWLTFALFNLIEFRKYKLIYLVLVIFSSYIIYVVKIYVLISFIPCVIIWYYLKNISYVRNLALRVLIIPVFIIAGLISSYFFMANAIPKESKYSIENLAETAAITAYDIRYWTGRRAGSGYSLGALNGSWQSMIQLVPAGIVVSLFRPYIWEVNNPLMLMASIESFLVLLLLLNMLLRGRAYRIVKDPFLIFSVVFVVGFAAAVGVSTYNFGTLIRYKLPMMPFLILIPMLVNHSLNKDRVR